MIEEPINREAVQDQLERMLSSPLFRNSKRYPGFLRFVVEHSLLGDREHLKERVLGVQVFGRVPDYDTNEDPIVRVTAGEVRKRIAQYYHEPSHNDELRIDLPPGSYVAEFHWQTNTVDAAAHLPQQTIEPAPIPPEPLVLTPTPPVAKPQRQSLPRLAWIGVGFGLACVIALPLWFWPAQRTVVDRFWAPVIGQDPTALICVGQRNFVAPMDAATRKYFPQILAPGSDEPKPDADVALSQLYYLGSQNIAIVDSVALAHIASLLESKNRKVQIRGERMTNLEDLRRQPAILIGGFSNDWSLLLTGPLRFRFRQLGEQMEVADSQNGEDHSRSLNLGISHLKIEEDFALVTRERDRNTDRFIVVFGGITGFGTQAAGEFLTNPYYMSAALSNAPPDWERKNIQIVLGTKVIRGTAGPPFVIATHFW